MRQLTFHRNFSLIKAGIFITGLACLFYTVYRAITLTMTGDEVSTLQTYGAKFMVYEEKYNYFSSNHHWLNSWLMFFSRSVFGSNEVAFRLHTMVAHAVYLFFTAKLMLALRKDIFALAGFILLNVHPYLLDFFSLARGYGLSFAGFAATVWFFYTFLRDRKTKQLFYAMLSISLAVLANFTYLNIFLLVCFLLGCIVTKQKIKGEASQKTSFQQLSIVFLFLAGLLAFVLPHLIRMKKAGAFFAGETSVWDGTIRSLCTALLYDMPYQGEDILRSCLPTIILLCGIILALNTRTVLKKEWDDPAGLLSISLSFILCGTIFSMWLQNILFGTPLPSTRVGLFLFVLFLFTLVCSLSTLRNFKKLSTGFVYVLVIPVLFHMVNCFNLDYVSEWRGAGNADELMKHVLQKEKSALEANRYVTISADGEASTPISWIQEKWKMSWLINTACWTYDPMPKADFYLVTKKFASHRNTSGWKMVDTFPVSGNALYIDTASPFYEK